MKLIIQQVSQASVLLVDTGEKRSIGQGVIVYICFLQEDAESYKQSIEKLLSTLSKMKMLSLGSEKIDQSLGDINGEILLISNFTIAGRMNKGTKVDFSKSAHYEQAQQMYEYCLQQFISAGFFIKSGEFGAKMEIESKVWGPLNYVIEM